MVAISEGRAMPDITIPPLTLPSRSRRWLRWPLRAGLISFALFALYAAFNHYRVEKNLRAALADLDEADPGWRLDEIEAAREVVPDAINSARVVVAAAEPVPHGWLPIKFDDELKKLPPQVRLSERQEQELQALLETFRHPLEIASVLPDRPRGRHQITYKPNVMDMVLNDQQRTRDITTLLRLQATMQAHRGEPGPALRSCLGALNAARSIGDEPIAISQLVRMACVGVTCKAAERVLAQSQPAAADLADLQRALLREDQFDSQFVVARGERAIVHSLFTLLERGDVTMSEVAGGPATWEERAFGFLIRDGFRAEHPRYLDIMTHYVEATRLHPVEQENLEKILTLQVAELPRSAFPSRMFLKAYKKMTEASRRRHSSVRAMATLLAVERYRLARGSWPDGLEQLVPEFLDSIPTDPANGDPIRYSRLPDGVVVYSISEDRLDNGGNIDCPNPSAPGCDAGFRLWDVRLRRAPAGPADAEEPE